MDGTEDVVPCRAGALARKVPLVVMQESAPDDGPSYSAVATTVLRVVRQLAAEVSSTRSDRAAALESSLDRDLGLDSLARVELRDRLERAFNVQLPDSLLNEIDTPAGWAYAVVETAGAKAIDLSAAAPARPRTQGRLGVAHDVATLCEALDWQSAREPDALHIRLLDHSQPQTRITELTYADVNARSMAIAGGLVACGVEPGQSVALMLPTSAEYFSTFLGVLRVGAIPVPIYPPVRRSRIAEHLRRQCGILANAGAVALVTVPEARPVARLLRSHVDSMRTLTTADELSRSAKAITLPVPASVRPDAIALLQYTSGSTGDPKGVMLTHRQLLANISAMGRAAQAGPADVFVSWLPLYHDMGLIGAWLSSLYLGFALVVMSPMDFLARPARWLHAIHEHRATLTAGPNFAFELCLRRIRDEEISGIDLSGMRMMFNGAEPVSPATVERFVERFASYDLRPNALAPVYGLAEAAVGLAFPPPGRAPVVDAVNRQQFQRHGLAVPPKDDDPTALRFVACGRPLPGYQLRVVDPSGHELPNRNEGRIEFTGPSATTGYFRNPEATAQLRSGSWLHTGDLGYIAGGDIYVTGRIKDVIIRAGRNLHPIELEEAIGTLPGVRTGCVAVFASPDPKAGTEKLVVLAETREHDPQQLERLRRSIIAVTIDLLGAPPDEVALAPPGAVLKTSSGKVRRAATSVRFEKGLTRSSGPSWWHLARFAWTGTLPSLRRRLRAARASVYAGYAWTVLVLIAVPTWLTIVMVPSRTLRWRTLRTAGRTLRLLLGIPVSVSGTEHIQECPPCLIVANHGSYLDGLALALALPHPVRFIVAADYERQPFVGVFLRRLGSEFVARRGPREGIVDTMHIEKLVRSGESVVVFPEGTRSRAPGLRPFHLGAFTVAGETGVPVVPAGIYGARDVLRPGDKQPRRGRIAVTFGHAIFSDGKDWAAAVELRDRARAAVLQLSGEPDTAII